MKSFSLFAAALALSAGSVFADSIFDATYKSEATTLPKVARNWKIELVTAPPLLRWPSVVECAPDGRIFVAEDPMDMPGPGDKPIDRILCIHPDGQVTVFAENLYAIFGMRYIDGKLYVHHTPKLSVFTDDNSVGKERKDIWDSDNPAPWNLGGQFNDHIPSNLRLGMDGYLYVSTGDKGIFGLKSNVDGRTAEIHGGGVLRVRPDGTGVEVYCTGTRNHLDVALNAEDEIFTYDNTDDGRGWWTRYTHMVDGGYYGYPHDYRPDDSNIKDMEWYRTTRGTIPYRTWTLWRIDETGGGAACGAVGYNEDALPEEYRGNSFNCEWGKQKIQRFQTVRDGASYKIERMEDIVTGGGEFHPVGISVTADGTGFYIADWQLGGWKTKQVIGRLLKLTYTGEMHPAPKPQWYVPAAQGQKFTATPEELIAGLSHPAESVRLVAQRRVAELGKPAVAPLIALMNDAKAPAFARWSAIWTLDRIESGASARAAIIAVASDGGADLSVRMQAVRQLGTRAAPEAVDACIALLGDPSAAMQFRAATALGRIGDVKAVQALQGKLDEKDFFAHFAMFTALKRIGLHDGKSWPAVVSGFASSRKQTLLGTQLAIHETFDVKLVEALAAFVGDSKNPAEARAAALLALAEYHHKRRPWDGLWWGTQPQRNPEAPKNVEWEGTSIVLSSIRGLLRDREPAVRSAALQALQIAPDPASVGALVTMFKDEADPAVRKGILHALAMAKSPDAMPIVASLLKDPKAHADLVSEAISVAESVGSPEAIDALITLAGSDTSPDVLESSFTALGRMRAKKAVGPLKQQVSNANAEVAKSAATALGAVGGKESAEALISAVSEPRVDVRKAVVVALGDTQDPAAVPALVSAAKDATVQTEAITALTKRPDPRAIDAYLDGIGSKDAGLRSLCRKAITDVSNAALPIAETRLEKGPPLTPTAISELQRIYAKSDAIRNWQIIGPFAESQPDGLDPARIADLIHLPAGLKNADKKELSWKSARTNREGYMDLTRQFDPHEHVYAYAAAEVNAASEREAALSVGHDDGMILYVNGKKVYEDLGNHSWAADQAHVNVHLKAGTNLLIAKITQDGGPWGFSVATSAEHKGKLFEIDTKSTDVKTYDAYAAGHEGDPAKGDALFHNAQGVGCVKCHAIAGQGGNVGPDLTGIGMKYNRAQLIESVLYPSKTIAAGYEQTMIRTKDGNVQAGVVRGESDTEVTLYDSSANKIVVRKVDIDVRKTSNVSVMPEGLQAGLSHQQFADLIAYLQSLKEPGKK